MHYQGRDQELAELASNLVNNNSQGSKHSDPVGSIKGNIDGGKGIGRKLILSIMKRRRVLAGENVDSADAVTGVNVTFDLS